jgi:hypothetical protein
MRYPSCTHAKTGSHVPSFRAWMIFPFKEFSTVKLCNVCEIK